MPALRLPDGGLTDGVIVIRERLDSDADAFVAACQDPEIPRWTLVPSPYRREHFDEWQVSSAQAAAEGTGLHVAAFDAADGSLIGAIGLVEVDQERGYAEIGYWTAAGKRGKGYTARALRLIHSYAVQELGLPRVEVLIDPENEPSHRVARSAGFVATGRRSGPARCGFKEVVVYVKSAP